MAQGQKTFIDQEVLEELTSTLSDTQIAKKLGLAVSTVFLWRKKYKILSLKEKTGNRQERTSGRTLNLGEGTPHKNRDSEESTYFKQIDSPSKAYFLGLIAADGSIYWNNDKYLNIELKCPDNSVLYTLASELRITSEVKVYLRKDKNNTKYGRLRVYNKYLVKSLMDAGIKTDNTKNEGFLQLSRELRPHYLRGLIDGDGCIKEKTKTLYFGSCSENLVNVFKTWISEHFKVSCSVTQKKLRSGKTFYTITFGRKPREVLSWLYENDQISIPRKKKEALRWICNPE